MISRFLSLFNLGMRAYKIQDAKRETRIGITAKSFEDLLDKGCKKLKVWGQCLCFNLDRISSEVVRGS